MSVAFVLITHGCVVPGASAGLIVWPWLRPQVPSHPVSPRLDQEGKSVYRAWTSALKCGLCYCSAVVCLQIGRKLPLERETVTVPRKKGHARQGHMGKRRSFACGSHRKVQAGEAGLGYSINSGALGGRGCPCCLVPALGDEGQEDGSAPESPLEEVGCGLWR